MNHGNIKKDDIEFGQNHLECRLLGVTAVLLDNKG
jgi:hypothetical protein